MKDIILSEAIIEKYKTLYIYLKETDLLSGLELSKFFLTHIDQPILLNNHLKSYKTELERCEELEITSDLIL